MNRSEEDRNIEMPRDYGLLEELDNASYYYHFNDRIEEEKEIRPFSGDFKSRAGSIQGKVKHHGNYPIFRIQL